MSDSLCLLTPELPAWNKIYSPEISKYFLEILEYCHILLCFNSATENKLPSLLKGNLNMNNCCLDLHITYFKNYQEMNISDCLIEINCKISTTFLYIMAVTNQWVLYVVCPLLYFSTVMFKTVA